MSAGKDPEMSAYEDLGVSVDIRSRTAAVPMPRTGLTVSPAEVAAARTCQPQSYAPVVRGAPSSNRVAGLDVPVVCPREPEKPAPRRRLRGHPEDVKPGFRGPRSCPADHERSQMASAATVTVPRKT